jgi:U3 small nucleolar RNA-associated protein 14
LLSAPAIVDSADAKRHQNLRAKNNTSKAHSDAVILHDFLSSSDDEDGPTSFAGVDALSAFRAEKSQVVKDEDDKVIDAMLLGWGSWTGEGISKNRNHSKKPRLVTVEKGIRPDARKDAKLDRVIINEKRVKKVNAMFLMKLFLSSSCLNHLVDEMA